MSLDLEDLERGTDLVKRGFAKMQKGGVIMDVTSVEEAAIAEEAGAVAVMALDKVPADIRAVGGVARMVDPVLVEEIIESVTIPVMAKCRIGHTAEAQVLQETGADMIDESEVLTPADPFLHIDKEGFETPFVCGARDLGEALRRVDEGAAMIRTKGEAGTGNVVEAVRHQRTINREIAELQGCSESGLRDAACEMDASVDVVKTTSEMGRIPVVNFAAGGIATPADAALMMQLGSDGVFVGSGIFKSEDPERTGRAIVEGVANYDDPAKLREISEDLGAPMRGQDVEAMSEEEKLQQRGQ